MQTLTLKNGLQIPAIGFGTWKLQGDACTEAVINAIEAGFRLIDTADSYANHKKVGEAIKKSGLKREEIFLTTKVWYEKLTTNEVTDSVDRFLEELGVSYIDLLLIHWPNHNVPIRETLEAMNKAVQQRRVHSIGVSNFTIKHLNEIKSLGIDVMINQVEFHPSFNQRELKKYCDKEQIIIEAHSPNGQGKDLIIPEIIDIARAHFATEYQVILAWLRQEGIIALPRSKEVKHIKENYESLKINLKSGELTKINNLKQEGRILNFGFSEFDY